MGRNPGNRVQGRHQGSSPRCCAAPDCRHPDMEQEHLLSKPRHPELIAPLEVAGLGSVSAHIRQLMFLDVTKVTQLERSDGVWPAVEHSVAPSAATST